MALTVDQKLKLLESIQNIDCKLGDIKTLRGDLPEEVKDLEDEIQGYDTRLTKYAEDIQALNDAITAKKDGIKVAIGLVAKYKDQLTNVRNNREFDAITSEIELQELESQVLEKKIKEDRFAIENKEAEVTKTTETLDGRKIDLVTKKSELTELIEESEGEEDKLIIKREKAQKRMDERLYTSYERIRTNARNGLAVVHVKREACGGCFNSVPPQRQYDIRERKKLIVCEHCGRILSGVEEVVVVEKVKKTRKTAVKKTKEA